MSQTLSRNEVIELVRKIVECEGSEEEINNWIDLFEANVPHLYASDLIFYPDRETTPEETVDRALNYRSALLG